jgi:PhnB protein
MKSSIHLTFAGQCEAAFRFYERCLHGTIVTLLTYGDSPMAAQVPAEWRGKIVHATLAFGESQLAGADVLPRDYELPRGFFTLLDMKDPAEAERVFDTLSDGGTIRMPLQETFWAIRFGVLVDQFGIPWEINCGRGN